MNDAVDVYNRRLRGAAGEAEDTMDPSDPTASKMRRDDTRCVTLSPSMSQSVVGVLGHEFTARVL